MNYFVNSLKEELLDLLLIDLLFNFGFTFPFLSNLNKSVNKKILVNSMSLKERNLLDFLFIEALKTLIVNFFFILFQNNLKLLSTSELFHFLL